MLPCNLLCVSILVPLECRADLSRLFTSLDQIISRFHRCFRHCRCMLHVIMSCMYVAHRSASPCVCFLFCLLNAYFPTHRDHHHWTFSSTIRYTKTILQCLGLLSLLFSFHTVHYFHFLSTQPPSSHSTCCLPDTFVPMVLWYKTWAAPTGWQFEC